MDRLNGENTPELDTKPANENDSYSGDRSLREKQTVPPAGKRVIKNKIPCGNCDLNVSNSNNEEILLNENDSHLPMKSRHSVTKYGLNFVIENAKGSTRVGVSIDGEAWKSILPADYGYIEGTKGTDGDELDMYLGPNVDSERVFVVDQNEILTGEFDEHKIIFGSNTLEGAKNLYIDGFSDNRGSERIRDITPVSLDEFKKWIAGITMRPFKDYYESVTKNIIKKSDDNLSTKPHISNLNDADK